MIALDVTFGDVLLVIIVCGTILLLAAGIIWACLRDSNKIGPLAAAEQELEIEKTKIAAVLAAKEAEAKMALTDAAVVTAQAKVVEANAKARQVELNAMNSLESGGTV